MSTINFDEFKKVDIRIGKVTNAERVEGADRLLRLEVDFGDFKRQIASAIGEQHSPESLIGRQFPFVVNLEPRTFRGIESQGMLMATGTQDHIVLISPTEEVPIGSEVV